MSKKVIIAVVAVVVVAALGYFFVGGGAASCSAEEYSKKAQAVQGDIMALQQKDPKAFQDVMVKMQDMAQKMAANPNDFGPACKALDEIAAIAKQ